MCAIKRLKRKEKSKRKHAHKNRYTYTCYNITSVQFDRGLACKKIIQSSKINVTPVLEHPNIKTEHKTDLHKSLTHAVVMAGTAEIRVRNRTSTKTLKVSKIIYISVKKKLKKKQKRVSGSALFKNQYFLPTALFEVLTPK